MPLYFSRSMPAVSQSTACGSPVSSADPAAAAAEYAHSTRQILHTAEKTASAVVLTVTGSGPLSPQQALEIAVSTAGAYLEAHDADITLVLPEPETAIRIEPGLARCIAQTYRPPVQDFCAGAAAPPQKKGLRGLFANAKQTMHSADSAPAPREEMCCEESFPAALPAGLSGALREIDESFTEMLLRKIDEKGMTDAACYKRANIDRKLFSKIRSDRHYRPKKVTALAFAIALELPLSETAELLRKAGYALSHSSRFDIIVEFFIANGIYDIYRINEALFAYDELLIGA